MDKSDMEIKKDIKIIDTHVHLGYDHVYDCENKIEDIIDGMSANSIFKSLLIPFTNFYEQDVINNHDLIFEACKVYKEMFYGICCPNPHLSDDFVRDEIVRCIKVLGFVGIKLNTQAHAVNPLSKDGKKIFKIAADLEIPIMVHTGSGVPFSLPSLLIPIAEEFSDLKVVILHSGQYFSDESVLIAERYSNIFLETTWTPVSVIGSFIKRLGSEKIMFGSDHIANISVELKKYENLNLDFEDLKNCLEINAKKIFRLDLLN